MCGDGVNADVGRGQGVAKCSIHSWRNLNQAHHARYVYTLESPLVGEAALALNIDCAVIDMEHGHLDMGSVMYQVRVFRVVTRAPGPGPKPRADVH